ncbi:hypothetical protein KCP69_18525 [Salmonella enterica subsp. enterica]|nr:hypothetical protein KCP69_18525 [Salmonella enterica subsp. enterica]
MPSAAPAYGRLIARGDRAKAPRSVACAMDSTVIAHVGGCHSGAPGGGVFSR